MNTLSWLLYAANLAHNLFGVLTFLAIALGGIGVIAVIAAAINNSEMNDDMKIYHRTDRQKRDYWKTGRGWLFACIFFSLVAAAMPSERTVYLIIASQMGETVVTSPDMQEIFQAMKKKVLDYLKETEPKSEPEKNATPT